MKEKYSQQEIQLKRKKPLEHPGDLLELEKNCMVFDLGLENWRRDMWRIKTLLLCRVRSSVWIGPFNSEI